MPPVVGVGDQNMSPKVWVVQEGKNNYAPAEKFGEVHFVTCSDLQAMADSRQNKHVESDVRKFKADYLAGVDYIVPVGNPMVIVLTVMALQPGNHNFLKWDGRRATYVPFTLNPNKVS